MYSSKNAIKYCLKRNNVHFAPRQATNSSEKDHFKSFYLTKKLFFRAETAKYRKNRGRSLTQSTRQSHYNENDQTMNSLIHYTQKHLKISQNLPHKYKWLKSQQLVMFQSFLYQIEVKASLIIFIKMQNIEFKVKKSHNLKSHWQSQNL